MKYPDTQLLRAMAILLILNSHLDNYYPIPYVGTGGAIGNSIFFFLSGFGIRLSQRKQSKEFSVWYKKRISRIYPSVWIVLIFLITPSMLLNGSLTSDTIEVFAGNFFFPPYWFLQALLIYYLLSYHLITKGEDKVLIVLSGLCFVYLAFYISWVDLTKWSVEKSPFDKIHYFMIFLFGIFIARKNKNVAYSGLHNYLILLFFIGSIYFHKFLMMKGTGFNYQFLQQAAMYPIVFYLLKVSRSPLADNFTHYSKLISRVIEFLSTKTLEIYMVHEVISTPILKLQLPFPINITFFLSLTFGLSALVNIMAGGMRNRIM